MTAGTIVSRREDILAAILSEEGFWPSEPRTVEETGIPVSVIESLLYKRLAVSGLNSGRQLAKHLCLPFHLLSDVLRALRERQIIVHKGSAPFNDYMYALTEQGRERARIAMKACAYMGPAPVPLQDYVLSVEAQSIRAESPRREQLVAAFDDISVNEDLFDLLGPAINSGAGLFLYGNPGNGKSTLARRVTRCFGQRIWLPQTLFDDGQIIKLYDAALHDTAVDTETSASPDASFDGRWVRIRRPTVVVGGELTMDALEIRHDPISNVSEAPLQLKSNSGCFLIDDFGRQRVEPRELLNRWIVPLESRVDYLTLSTGKKIQVPFEQLIIFSTNLQPHELVDEAFLRRIPYKIEIDDPTEEEFHELFELYARDFECEYRPDVVDYLVRVHYREKGRALRRCHPRDLLSQIRDFCTYHNLPIEMRDDYFDRVIKSYFAVVVQDKASPRVPKSLATAMPVADARRSQPIRTPLPPRSTPPQHSVPSVLTPRGDQTIPCPHDAGATPDPTIALT
jgi:hypothetical protein